MSKINQFLAEHLINTKIFYIAKHIYDFKELCYKNIIYIIANLIVLRLENTSDQSIIEKLKHNVQFALFDVLGYPHLNHKDFNSKYKYLKQVCYDTYEFDKLDTFEYLCATDIYHLGCSLHYLGYDDYDTEESQIKIQEITKEIKEKYLDKLIDIIAKEDFKNIKEFIDKL